jgi:copper chaperone
MSSTVTYSVTGLTCDHCVGAVTSELSAVPSVTDVTVELVVDGASRVVVTSDAVLDDAAVREALDEAGDYVLVGRAD